MNVSLKKQLLLLDELQSQGGPRPEQDTELSNVITNVHAAFKADVISTEDLDEIRRHMNFTPETMQGFAYLKPNGYAGCFEIIDRIYQEYHAENPKLYNWDRYWQGHPAAQAVRNRKDYFIKLVHLALERRQSLSILNLASGPCRDICELFEIAPDLPITIHCVEQDERAIAHAVKLCEPFKDKITFHKANVLRFSTHEKFDLIWSSGLFDYLSDGLFAKLLRKMAKHIKPDGEIVVGNFSPMNPSLAYMELFDWILIHRSPEELYRLAVEAGFSVDNIEVQSEELAINLFLHLHNR